MPYFTYQNHSCYYQAQGDGTPLLLLHGNTASSNMLIELASLFAHRYQTVLIDFLGHGRSDRVESLAPDLWFDEAQQVIAFLEQTKRPKARLIGSSGGALVALNVALERPDLVEQVIADSFEGEAPLALVIETLWEEREASKRDPDTRAFYQVMQGEDWEHVVDCDTQAMLAHANTIGTFFHRPLDQMQPDVLLTGSMGDEFLAVLGADFYHRTFSQMIETMGKGSMRLFPKGGHPAALTNPQEFVEVALQFFETTKQEG